MVPSTQRGQSKTILPINTQASHYKWLVTAIVLIAGATNTFAGNSINLAVPRLMAYFGTDLATAQWVSTGFQITRTLVVPILGWLGGVLVGYIIIYRTCMFAVFTPLTALNVQSLAAGQVRMGQGLLGVVRNIGGSLGGDRHQCVLRAAPGGSSTAGL